MQNENYDTYDEIFHILLNETFLISKIYLIENKIELLKITPQENQLLQRNLKSDNLPFFTYMYHFFPLLKIFLKEKKELIKLHSLSKKNYKKIELICKNKNNVLKISSDEKELILNLFQFNKKTQNIIYEQSLNIFSLLLKIKSFLYDKAEFSMKELNEISIFDSLDDINIFLNYQNKIQETIKILYLLGEIADNIFQIRNKKEKMMIKKDLKKLL